MHAVSLFSGVGGFELGFDRAGIDTLLQAESDPWCLQVLERHWPEVERLTDVRQVDAATRARRCRDMDAIGPCSDTERFRAARRWLDHADSIDLVYGGFPCQDVSVAGQRAGLSGQRSSLWFEFERVLRELRPRWTLVENVPGLLSSGPTPGADFGVLLRGLVELGYGVAWRTLDARWFGVPQRRRRVFVVGCLGDARRAAQVLAVCEGCGGHPPTSKEAWEGLTPTTDASPGSTGVIGAPGDEGFRALTARETGYRMDFETENFLVASTLNGGEVDDQAPSLVGGDGPHGRSTFNGMDVVVADPIGTREGKTWTHEGKNNFRTHNLVPVANGLRASDGHHGHSSPRGDGADNRLSAPTGVRRLTPLECERLMGWPDDWTRWTGDGRELPDSHRYRMCGNGVVATIAEWLGHRLVAVDEQQGGSA
jgi:DNA (cytosine-5)-methyltransferase 1